MDQNLNDLHSGDGALLNERPFNKELTKGHYV